MYTKKTLIVGVIINLFLVACGSSKQASYVVDNYSPKTIQDKAVYDEKAKLNYSITKDNDFAYITLNSFERATQIKMMQNGVRVFFDKSGKKNTDNFVQYPVAKKSEKMDMEQLKNLRNNPQAMMLKLQERMGTDILLSVNGEERIINNELNGEQISTEILPSPNGMVYTLKVPISFIASNDDDAIIGIQIKGMERPNINGGNRPTGMRGGGRGGMRGGGMRGGGMRGGGMRGGQRPNMSQLQELQSDINLWIPIQIKQ